MTKTEFKNHIEKSLSELIQYAELYAGKELPKELIFVWSSYRLNSIDVREKIVDEILEKVYLSTDKIYPCVDLVVEKIVDDSKLMILGGIADYEPRAFQKGWSSRNGPFIYGVSQEIVNPNINTKDEQFLLQLKRLGLIHYVVNS